MKQTKQQQDVVAVSKEMKVGDVLKIDAGAGCAKSSTLVFIAEELKEPSICLVFNKAAQQEAEEKFPSHVVCKTTHSLAYASIGHKYQSKLSRPQGGYVNVLGTGGEIAKHFKIEEANLPNMKPIPPAFQGVIVKNTVNRFEQSNSQELLESHLPEFLGKIKEKECKGIGKFKKSLLSLAKKLWALRIDTDCNILATHDTYLKLYHLSKPVLPYNIIYLDEAQDSNPCVVDIVCNQKAKIIVVGDRYQAIYGWRGAINALDNIQGQEKFLTTSFRYGQDVADLASKVLEDKIILKSFAGLNTEVGEDVVDKTKPYTILYRTNQKLVLDAVRSIQEGNSVNIEIDVRDFCNMLTSAVELYRGQLYKVKHEDILCYNNFTEMKEEAEHSGAIKRLCDIIEKNQVTKVLNALNSHKNSRYAKITFTTAHKAKGREWDQVELADDFPLHIRGSEWVGLEPEEQNLLYVATTRAIKKMNINKSLKEIWFRDLGQEKVKTVIAVDDNNGNSEVFVLRMPDTLSDGVALALERAEIEAEQAYEHYSGNMTDEEAYDVGLLDEMGYGNYTLKDLTPT